MLQTLLVSSFENSGKIMAVGRDSIGLRADYAVQLDLRHFEATYQDGKPRAHVEINAKLIRMPQRDIVGYTDCNYLTDAEGDTIEHVVEAFNESLGRCMKRIVEYTLTTAKPPQQP